MTWWKLYHDHGKSVTEEKSPADQYRKAKMWHIPGHCHCFSSCVAMRDFPISSSLFLLMYHIWSLPTNLNVCELNNLHETWDVVPAHHPFSTVLAPWSVQAEINHSCCQKGKNCCGSCIWLLLQHLSYDSKVCMVLQSTSPFTPQA